MNPEPLRSRITHELTDQQLATITERGQKLCDQFRKEVEDALKALNRCEQNSFAKLEKQAKNSLEELAMAQSQPAKHIWRTCLMVSLVISVVGIVNALCYPHWAEWLGGLSSRLHLSPPPTATGERIRLWVRTSEGWQLLPLLEVQTYQRNGDYILCLKIQPPGSETLAK